MKKRRNVKSHNNSHTVDAHSKSKNFLTEAEVQRLSLAAYTSRYPVRNRLIINLMYRHGLRVSELINLKINDIDLVNARIWINRLKGGLSTEHPIDRKLILRDIKTYLSSRHSNNDPILLLNELGYKMTRQAINYIVKTAANKAHIVNVHPHTLRHSCGYFLANKGYDLRLIQDYLGHKDPRHTALYTRTNANRFLNLWD